jgi:SSS family solute:Na+ symporter
MVVGIYASLGGFRAVVATDKLQYIIVALYILIMTWLAFKGLWVEKGNLIPSSDTLALKSGKSWVDLAGPGILTIVIGLIAYLPGWLFETDLWLRIQAANSIKSARKGMVIASVNALVFVGILPLVIGVSSLVLFPPVNGAAPALLGNEGDTIFVALLQNYAQSWLIALAAIGLVAAAMSTIDTCVNVMALSIAYDMLDLHKKSDGKRFSQYITGLAIFAAGIFALNTESLWDIFYLSGGILTTSVAFPVAAVMLKGVNKNAVFWSSLFGFIGTIVAYFLQIQGILIYFQPGWLAESDLSYILWGILFAVIGYFVGSMLKNND